jgi:hypothetical protein
VRDERRLHDLLREAPLPPDDRRRAFALVQAAFAERERVSWPRRHARGLAVCAAALALVGAVLSPPGRAVLDDVRESIGIRKAQPALFSLPASGRLLVTSSAGSWVVSRDGSKRLLGPYREASWSPFGHFVVAARANELAALDPQGGVRWTIARPRARFPRWGGSRTDTRIAYLSGGRLRLVAGDGTGDRLLAEAVSPVAPAWRPGSRFVLAYARKGEVVAVEAKTSRRLWQHGVPGVRALSWSEDGRLLLVRARRSLVVLDAQGRTRVELLGRESAPFVEGAALAPDGRTAAVVERAGGRSQIWLIAIRPGRETARHVFSGAGSFDGLAWSPDGRWLLVSWRAANQWLFFRSASVRAIRGVSDIASQFDGFPTLEGWCCRDRSG